MEANGDNTWGAPEHGGRSFRFCANAQDDGCNWLLNDSCGEEFCLACRHNRTVPDLSDPENRLNWQKLEIAKRRLFYTLLQLGLPLVNRDDNPESGLAFDFLADPASEGEKVMTGHDNGIITLALKEADDAEREKRRTFMHEPYRTLLGHFRHEIGHYFWDRLVADEGKYDACRAVFGDEQKDYGDALKEHYEHGAAPDWQDHFVSTYATSHAWEDFAETWAHYLHIVDSLETASSFGLKVDPKEVENEELHVNVRLNPYRAKNIEQLINVWLPLTYALNAMNRSMGLNDIYPFVLSPEAIAKLGYIHQLVHAERSQSAQAA